MNTEPYASARRVFWVVDNGSSHRGQAACERLSERWHNATLVQLPIHASWLNQVEITSPLYNERCLHPTTFPTSPRSEHASLHFERRYDKSAKPFEWKFTRHDLALLMKKLADKPDYRAAA